MNLADPELEYIDPTPNVHSLFIHFDSVFFWTKLAGKAVVRWSKRMYSCAGICSYEGRGGICDIALSEPLLKLRPRKDLVETLLHEMIHAYLFVVGRDQSRDGHGPNFLAHMHRINKAAGVNISIYHDFHDEVKLYQNHVWRCNGPCQKVRPYFGIVRRSNNRAPGPSDFWWNTHKRVCGGTFIKCQEPEKPAKPVKQAAKKVNKSGDITKFINNNNATIKNKNDSPSRKSISGFNDLKTNKVETPKPVMKPAVFTGPGKTVGGPKTNSTRIVSPKPIIKSPVITSTSQTIRRPSSNTSVADTVRNIWANKTLPVTANITQKPNIANKATNKRMSDVTNSNSLTPPKKYKKIDDYFKTTASNILSDVYGKDIQVTQSSGTNKLKAVIVKETLVECPICNAKINAEIINSHIDECLNKDVVEKLSKETILIESSASQIKQETKNNIDSFNPYNSEPTKTESPINNRIINNITVKPEIKTEKDGYSRVKTEPSGYIDLTYIEIKQEATDRNIKDTIDLSNQPSTSTFIEKHNKTRNTENEQIKEEPTSNISKFKDLTNQASTSKATDSSEPVTEIQTCPCCDKTLDKPMQEHLDECVIFFDENAPEESLGDRTIVIDDSDDEFDETQTFNATGTKSPCPCCMKMVEESEMSNHLDICLGIKD